LLRITVHEQSGATTLKLEGKIAGPWVPELDRAWQSLIGSLGTKRLVVDLRGVTHLDAGGGQVLADIYQRSGAQFIADNPMTKYFAEQASSKI
jgi:anti-anti-sigma regulatory factor